MEPAYFEFGFFGSAVLWMLVTYPAYWFFQWAVEGEPFYIWSRAIEEIQSVAEIDPLSEEPLAVID